MAFLRKREGRKMLEARENEVDAFVAATRRHDMHDANATSDIASKEKHAAAMAQKEGKE